MAWAWERGEKLVMLPDQHLGRNTAFKMGVPLDEMVVWDPNETWGGLEPAQVQAAKLILWKGHCSVHTRFTVAQIDAFRKQYPGGRVIAHPECTFDVVQAADDSGSTEYIINTVREQPVRIDLGRGTEIHLVNRLTNEVAPRQDRRDARSVRLPVLDDVPRLAEPPAVGARRTRRRQDRTTRSPCPEPQKSCARLALDRMLTV